MYVDLIIIPYTLNLYSTLYQLSGYLNKTTSKISFYFI